jgi:hypothetical protein
MLVYVCGGAERHHGGGPDVKEGTKNGCPPTPLPGDQPVSFQKGGMVELKVHEWPHYTLCECFVCLCYSCTHWSAEKGLRESAQVRNPPGFLQLSLEGRPRCGTTAGGAGHGAGDCRCEATRDGGR